MSTPEYDIFGIGIGPFNLGLAALAAPLSDLKTLFVDGKSGFDWHPGLMLQSAHLQTPFLADLVTLADPTSKYSFLNFAKQTDRLYPFYIRENFFILRKEYNDYCRWAIEKLPNVRFGFLVRRISYLESEQLYRIEGIDQNSGNIQEFRARHLSLGTGTLPWMPFEAGDNPNISHSADYLNQKHRLQQSKDITLVGSGQSAAEIFYDLLGDIDSHDYRLRWITRSARFAPLEYTKLTLEMTSPEYIDYFNNLPDEVRKPLVKSQGNLYKAINSELINAIYDLLYQKRLYGDLNVQLLTNCQLNQLQADESGIHLEFTHQEQQASFGVDTQSVVMATGYRYNRPAFLDDLGDRLNLDQDGNPLVARNYSVDKDSRIFIQNYGLESHNITSPDLGMACYRNSVILAEVLGYAPYKVEPRIAFQHFGSPTRSKETARLESFRGKAG